MEQLKSFISPQIVDLIMEGKNTYDLSPRRMELTVLFSDIRGFTPLADELEPEELVQIINEYLTKAVDKRLMADVPFGVLLSGGLDSSLIASITNRLIIFK